MTIPRTPHQPDPDPSEQRTLRRLDPPREPGPGATFHAMAEALRANAEAMNQIDSSQRKMAESISKADRAASVVTSTKALNETFRGLSEIQRGLLDALVKERTRKVSSGPWPYLALVLLLALLTVLAWQQYTADSQIPREVYEEARRGADTMRGENAAMASQLNELRARDVQSDSEIASLRKRVEEGAVELAHTKEELGSNKAQVAQYLKVKDQADTAAGVLLANEQLQRENADLRRQLERARDENERLLKMLADGTLDGKLGDPEAIIAEAKKRNLYEEPKMPDPDATRSSRELTRIRRHLKRLFEGVAGEDGYELLRFRTVGEDGLLTDVEVGCYEKHQTVASIRAKTLEIRLDEKGDRVELRFKDGYIVNQRKPDEKIVLDPEGHSIFLKGVGVGGWMKFVGGAALLGPEGQLIWK